MKYIDYGGFAERDAKRRAAMATDPGKLDPAASYLFDLAHDYIMCRRPVIPGLEEAERTVERLLGTGRTAKGGQKASAKVTLLTLKVERLRRSGDGAKLAEAIALLQEAYALEDAGWLAAALKSAQDDAALFAKLSALPEKTRKLDALLRTAVQDYAQAGRCAMLIGLGADAKATGAHGSLLHLAAAKGCPVQLRILLDHGADVRVRDSAGRLAIHRAGGDDNQFCRVLSVLTHAGCGISEPITGDDGGTLLHLAAASNDVERIRCCYWFKADLEAVDAAGLTAWQVAEAAGKRAAMKELASIGCNTEFAGQPGANTGGDAPAFTGGELLERILANIAGGKAAKCGMDASVAPYAGRLSAELLRFDSHAGRPFRLTGMKTCQVRFDNLSSQVRKQDGCWVARVRSIFCGCAQVLRGDEDGWFASLAATPLGCSKAWYVHADDYGDFRNTTARGSLSAMLHGVVVNHIENGYVGHDPDDWATGLDTRALDTAAQVFAKSSPKDKLPASLDPTALSERADWLIYALLGVGDAKMVASAGDQAGWRRDRAQVAEWPHLAAYWLAHALILEQPEILRECVGLAAKHSHPAVVELLKAAKAGAGPGLWWDAKRITALRKAASRA